MKPFLSIVAHDLYKRCNGDLSHIVVIFPGKRASLFFNQYLLEESKGAPLFAPTYITLDELFEQLSELKIEDPIRIICLLHRIYQEQTKRNEPIDSFYSWGELMLSDFNDIDKNHINAKGLFSNLESIKEMSTPEEYLTPEQLDVLKHFFGNFNSQKNNSKLQYSFIQVWKVLGRIYNTVREQLSQQGLAYTGMLYRNAVETFQPEKLSSEKYVFIGFNVLSTVEEELFKLINDTGKALFYWDYDKYYLDSPFNEAGNFVRNNLKLFGNAIDDSTLAEEHPYDNLRNIQDITVISAPSDNAQASFVYDWLKGNITDPEQDTAIVLADEKLLPSVLHALPDDTIHDVNVTMGFPLNQTSVFHFLTELIEEKSEIENNSEWLLSLSNEIDKYGLRLKNREQRLQEEEEALYRTHLNITSLRRIVEDGTLNAGRQLLLSLLMQILKRTSIPFHGEPACGLQIMGVLETRNLDFRHILLLSTNEGMLPRSPSEISFIPYSLRKAFGLTTIERQTAVYAFYFYRLIQRAERVTLVYNNGTDGLVQSVPSRFITQLEVEWNGFIRHKTLLPPSASDFGSKPIVIQQNEENRQRLFKRFSPFPGGKPRILSPTALQDFMGCPLKFWLKYVEELKTNNDNTEEVTTAQFGTLFHKCAQAAYDKLTEQNSIIRKSDLESLANDKISIYQIVDTVFKEVYFKIDISQSISSDAVHYDGIHLINFAALERYLKKVLLSDAQRAPFLYHKSELEVQAEVSEGDITLTLGGYIDRIDQKENVLRIVDYKTGGKEYGIDNISELFGEPGTKRNKQKVFQAFYYAWVLCQENLSAKDFKLPSDVTVSPALYYIKKATDHDYDPTLSLNKSPLVDFRKQVYDDFDRELHLLLKRIFNSEEPFTQAKDNSACKYCDFCDICHRKKQIY